jgi:hypothetical protein
MVAKYKACDKLYNTEVEVQYLSELATGQDSRDKGMDDRERKVGHH